jgi:Na+-transporting methylmalonyl-CoA/oxaloacetate decarboxylase gamma subunit
MGIDWGQAGITALIGFVGVFVILFILSICVGITSKLVRVFEHKPVEEKKKEEKAVAS